jgi:hydrogenase maturation protease
MKRPLVIGYGNPLREDDGIGPRAAEIVQQSLAPGAARVLQCQQLTPELALEIEDTSRVIFLDAALDQPPGEITLTNLQKAESSAWSHHLTPRQLLSLVEDPPPAYAITCGVLRTGWREGMTAEGEHNAVRMAIAALSLLPEPRELAGLVATHTSRPVPRR